MTPMWVESRSTISRMCEVRKIVPPRATNDMQQILDLARGDRVDAFERLVEEQQPRRRQQRRRQRQLLAHAVRDSRSTSVLAGVLRSISCRRSAERLVAVGVSMPCTSATNVSVSSRGQPIEQREILGHDADAPLDGDRIGQRIEAEDPHRARGRLQQPGQALDRRGLAGAVRPEEAVEAAGGNREVDAVDGAELPKSRVSPCVSTASSMRAHVPSEKIADTARRAMLMPGL